MTSTRRQPRPRLGPEHKDQGILRVHWRLYRRIPGFTPRDVLRVATDARRAAASLEEAGALDEQHEIMKRWIVRNQRRFSDNVGKPAVMSKCWAVAARRGIPTGPSIVGFGLGHDDLARKIANYAADKWAEAALEAALKENRKP